MGQTCDWIDIDGWIRLTKATLTSIGRSGNSHPAIASTINQGGDFSSICTDLPHAILLRAYPNNPAALRAVRAQAK